MTEPSSVGSPSCTTSIAREIEYDGPWSSGRSLALRRRGLAVSSTVRSPSSVPRHSNVPSSGHGTSVVSPCGPVYDPSSLDTQLAALSPTGPVYHSDGGSWYSASSLGPSYDRRFPISNGRSIDRMATHISNGTRSGVPPTLSRLATSISVTTASRVHAADLRCFFMDHCAGTPPIARARPSAPKRDASRNAAIGGLTAGTGHADARQWRATSIDSWRVR
mmetsp:Transcript_1766/g.4480  ORF Transcript_1766/g.4480 Transcript_1766/m.4480 type:complete len:220 (-) Transcript_1766:2391-3050(-)